LPKPQDIPAAREYCLAADMKRPKIIISINASWNVVNFRAGLVRALQASGYDVVALAPADEFSSRFADMGVAFEPIKMDARGTSPFNDALLLGRYYRALKRIRPDVYLGYTAKPNIYGSLAAGALGIPVINNVAGLGVAFLSRNWLNLLIRNLYKAAFRRSAHVFFQNPDDMALFRSAGLVDPTKTSLLPGSGIDLDRFRPGTARSEAATVTLLMVTRLLWAKGVGEFVESARQLRDSHPQARFQIAGIIDDERREGVPRAELKRWQENGLVEYLGALDDVRPALRAADCVVLPSYYPEGTPRSLLEAAAMAKPLITCDVPGCREVVRDGVNGFLCEPQDAASLAVSIRRMIELPQAERMSMGEASRREAEQRFDERIVTDRYIEEIGRLLSRPKDDGRRLGPARRTAGSGA
jgi:glycosyltransferase involved in cell wall biosynthesis